MKKAKAVEAQIKKRSKTHGLCLKFVSKIQITVVQLITLYKAEFW